MIFAPLRGAFLCTFANFPICKEVNKHDFLLCHDITHYIIKINYGCGVMDNYLLAIAIGDVREFAIAPACSRRAGATERAARASLSVKYSESSSFSSRTHAYVYVSTIFGNIWTWVLLSMDRMGIQREDISLCKMRNCIFRF